MTPEEYIGLESGYNITQYTFAPISYKVAWSKLGSQGLGGKFFEVQRDVPLQKFKRTQLANNISNVADTITVLATGDSTHNETLRNDYGFGKLMSMLNDIRKTVKGSIFKEDLKDFRQTFWGLGAWIGFYHFGLDHFPEEEKGF